MPIINQSHDKPQPRYMGDILKEKLAQQQSAERDDYSGLRFYEGLFLGLLISALFWAAGLWFAFT